MGEWFVQLAFKKFSLPYAAVRWAPVACIHKIGLKNCLVNPSHHAVAQPYPSSMSRDLFCYTRRIADVCLSLYFADCPACGDQLLWEPRRLQLWGVCSCPTHVNLICLFYTSSLSSWLLLLFFSDVRNIPKVINLNEKIALREWDRYITSSLFEFQD